MRSWGAVFMMAGGASLLAAAAYTSNAKSSPTAGHSFRQGGTFRVNLPSSDIDDIDPSLAYGVVSWHIEYSTALKLLNYPETGPRRTRLVPEGASSYRVSRDGKTYTFTIRKGFRFSNGERVTAKNYAYAINRSLDRALQSPGSGFIESIVGAQEVRRGEAATARGVRVRGNKLVIRLTKPEGTFLAKLSLPFFQAIPLGLPLHLKAIEVGPGKPLPSAGPYYVSRREPNIRVRLARNPFYAKNVKGRYQRRPRRLSAIEIRVQRDLQQSYQEVRANQADYTYYLPPGVAGPLGEEFGLEGRFRVRPTNCIGYLALNSNNRLFQGNPQLRRAVNYVIDRRAMTELSGAYAKVPTDQYLPAGFPGFENIDAYPLTSDVARAQDLARGHVPAGGPWIYYYGLSSPGPQRMELVRAALAQIGITISPQGFRGFAFWDAVSRPNAPYAFADAPWCASDYADPSEFIDANFYGDSGANIAHFNDPAYNDRMDRAAKLTGAARLRAYERIEHDLVTKAAPWASWGQSAKQFFFSDSVDTRSFRYQSIYEAPPYNLLALK